MASLLLSRCISKPRQLVLCNTYLPAVATQLSAQKRCLTHYPIDDIVTGLSEEQIQVSIKFSLKTILLAHVSYRCIILLPVEKDGV